MPAYVFFRYFFFSTIFVLSCFYGACIYMLHNNGIDLSILENYDPGKPSILLDDQGNEWARFQLDRREPIKLDAMPQHLIHAFLAAEDWHFFSHAGISYKGIIRSLLVNMYHGRIVQGASTITQQLVKLLFLDSQKTLTRKIKEQCVACIVERQCTKQQILQTYLNHVYFGCGIYGVQAASQRFFGKNAHDVSLDEAALLACVVRSPGRYCPLICPLSAQKRRNIILQSMLKLTFITHDEYVQAKDRNISIKHDQEVCIAPHVREYIRAHVESMVGKNRLYSGGLVIQTTLNSALQKEAVATFKQHCDVLKSTVNPFIDGGLITMEVKTGEIKALLGGYDFKTSQFNRALHAKRQMGSTFKPLIYATALKSGKTFADTALDEPIEIIQGSQVWRPKNAYQKFNNQMTLAHALSHSNNIVTIKTLFEIGFPQVIEVAKKCRIEGELQPLPSLALGCVDASVKEVVGMFNVFARHGRYVEPHLIKSIKDRLGNKIYKVTATEQGVLPMHIADQVSHVLRLGLQRVRARYPGSWIESDAISKTGTTNDSRTCWFVGSTPDYTTGLYLGTDDNKPLGKDIYPASTCLPIWLAIHQKLPILAKNFEFDPSLKEIFIDEKTGYQVRHRGSGVIPILIS